MKVSDIIQDDDEDLSPRPTRTLTRPQHRPQVHLQEDFPSHVNVKILQGVECNVDVVSDDSVDRLKELVQVGSRKNIIFLVFILLIF